MSKPLKYYVVFGTEEFLNQLYVKYLQTPNCFYSFAESPFHGKIEHYFILTGEYVVTAHLDPGTKAGLDRLFKKVKDYSDINVGEVAEVFSRRGKMTCSIEHKPKKARRLQKKFCCYFGVEQRQA